MENLELLSELVKIIEKEKIILNGELASLYKKQAESSVNQKQIADKISAIEAKAAPITKEKIEKYKTFWHSLSLNHAPPCPLCFIVKSRHSNLQAEPRTTKEEHFSCEECKMWFHIPLPGA